MDKRFAQLDEKTVWVFVPKEYNLKDLKETIAHEIGHIVEIEYPTNPEQIEENDELHEMKADHYMNFYNMERKTHWSALLPMGCKRHPFTLTF